MRHPAARPLATGKWSGIAGSWPGIGRAAALSVFWSLSLLASLVTGLWIVNGLEVLNMAPLVALFMTGALLSATPTLWLATLVSGRGGRFRRFVAFFLILGLATFAAIAFLFAMQYRLYYSQWHEPFGSRIWFFQFAFTSASAVYQFAIFCIGHGLVALVPLSIASLWFARLRD